MSRQVIVGGSPSALNTTATRYTSLMGNNYSWNASDAFVRQVYPTSANLYFFRVELTTAPGEGKSYTFTLATTVGDTPITLTISGADKTGEDLVHAVAFSSFSRPFIKCVPSGTPAASTAKWTITSDSVIPVETVLIAGTAQNLSASGVFYSLVGTATFNSPGDFGREIIFPTSGTVKKLFVVMFQPAGTDDSYIFTFN